MSGYAGRLPAIAKILKKSKITKPIAAGRIPLHTVLWADTYQIELPRAEREWRLFRDLVIARLLASAPRRLVKD